MYKQYRIKYTTFALCLLQRDDRLGGVRGDPARKLPGRATFHGIYRVSQLDPRLRVQYERSFRDA